MADLNIDLGELPHEPEELYALATRANVACGGHAGDLGTMARAVELARTHGAALGAHPSYPDRERFGRVALDMPPGEVARSVYAQCAALASVARAVGAPVVHAKLHGALYHAAAKDPELACAVLGAVSDALGAVTVVGPETPAMREAVARWELALATEGFADRRYLPDGALAPRSEPDAVLADSALAAAQARALAPRFDTLCVHGDNPKALEVARAVRAALDALAPGSPRPFPTPARFRERPLGDTGVCVELPRALSPATRLAALEAGRALPGATDAVLGDDTIAVFFAAGGAVPGEAAGAVRDACAGDTWAMPSARPPREHVVGVVYDGPDLEELARATGLSTREVVALHAGRPYAVHFVGFQPGFGYLVELPPALQIPRRATPRTRVPAGAVGLAGRYTAVYPRDTPGAWHLIGRAPEQPLVDPAHDAIALAVGDTVRFEVRSA